VPADVEPAPSRPADPSGARTGPPSRPEQTDPLPPLRVALRPYAGPITVLALALAGLLVAAVIVMIGARQPSLIISSTDPPTESFVDYEGAKLPPDWTTTGKWQQFKGTAMLSAPAADGLLSSATIQKDRDVDIAAKMVGIDGLGGIVFRYSDQKNYGIFFPVPQFGTWQLRVVQDGKVVQDENLGLQPTIEGSVGEIVANGDFVVALIDNRVIKKVAIPATLRGTGFGFGSLPGATTTTRFDDIVAINKADR